MSVGLTFSMFFLVVCTIALVPPIRRIWRGDERTIQRMKSAFFSLPVGSDVRQAMVRGVVALHLQLSFTFATVVLMAVGTSRWHGGSKFTPWTVSALVTLTAAMSMFATQVTIIWFNRPRFLVPPPLRGEAGVWARRRTAKQLMAEAYESPDI